jgi:hypothetical protein
MHGSALKDGCAEGDEIVESNRPDAFFENPQGDRTKLFLCQILSH